ncbi:MAG: 3-dehydroquinate synthase [Candidatus Thorarchaeota archaeon]|jgi:3-dehydroquinate synthase
MMLVSFEVTTKSRDYPVCVGENILPNIGESFSETTDRVFVVTDDDVAKILLDSLTSGLSNSGIEAITKVLPSGENIKSLSTAEDMYDFLLKNHGTRSDLLLALGGGVIGDLAGFVASTYKRGMGLIHAPTTLLAQVDSALGGKTGVNMPDGKNLVGTFYQPHAVVADVSVLKTLPDDDFASGLGEVVKYGAIMDNDLLGILMDNRDEILRREPEILSRVVERCLRNKARIVEEDEREEERKREILNFGHTIGHAVETCSKHKIPHGHAVAIGMVEEAHFAVREGFLDDQSLQSLISILSMFGLPTSIPSKVDMKEFEEVIRQDKKVRQGQLMLPVLMELGRTELKAVEPPHALIRINGGE